MLAGRSPTLPFVIISKDRIEQSLTPQLDSEIIYTCEQLTYPSLSRPVIALKVCGTYWKLCSDLSVPLDYRGMFGLWTTIPRMEHGLL